MTIMVDIIDTTLQTMITKSAMMFRTIRGGTHKGCSDPMPNFEASRPVKNGSTADPAWPTPPIHPTPPVKSHFGMISPDCLIRIGYMGPSRRPMNETASAFSSRDGTTQTVTSSLVKMHE